jgi:hypothetical protein
LLYGERGLEVVHERKSGCQSDSNIEEATPHWSKKKDNKSKVADEDKTEDQDAVISKEHELNQQEMIDSPAQAYRGALNEVIIAQNMPNHINKFVRAIKARSKELRPTTRRSGGQGRENVQIETRRLHEHMKWCYKCMHSLIADVASSLVANSPF